VPVLLNFSSSSLALWTLAGVVALSKTFKVGLNILLVLDENPAFKVKPFSVG
jgi:hypothetical protein